MSSVLQMDPAMLIAAAVVGLGLLGLAAEALFSGMRRATSGKSSGKSPIVVIDKPGAAVPFTRAEHRQALAVEAAPKAVPEPVAPRGPPKDPLAEQWRFFTTLGAALSANEDTPPLAALHANLSADVFMERMTLATKSWRPDGFGTGARNLVLKAEGTPPDAVADKVLEGYEQLKLGHVKEALDAFLAGIEAAKVAAEADAGNPWPHAWSAFAWRGLALIAEEAGDAQASLAGLKVAYQSMVNAFEVTMQGAPATIAEAA